jgi:hypothetical protein
MANAPRFTKTIVSVPIVKISDTTLTTVYAVNATYDSRITGINISTDDTSAQNAALFISDGVTDFPIGTLAITIGAGITVAVASIGMIAGLSTVFRERDSNGITILNLAKGNSLKVKMAAVTGGKFFYVLVKAELYD